ncbi:MAG: glutathione S-transferase N-terminal domain-containing protein [Methyloceanibacter sp.]|uniref:glutathione S-transferase N-terminal domain-containing protein n=1 Tax=Methyloceanibacter sp. TaxID=1965321 RepID=UPI003D9B187A
MAALTLYHAIPSRFSIVRWMLEEIGEPYELEILNLSKGEQLGPDYLAINPMGKVPALKHSGYQRGRRRAPRSLELTLIRNIEELAASLAVHGIGVVPL